MIDTHDFRMYNLMINQSPALQRLFTAHPTEDTFLRAFRQRIFAFILDKVFIEYRRSV